MGGRGTNCNSKGELKKGPWTREEDLKLLSFIQEHGHGSWRNLPPKAGLQRGGKSCRLRWMNYLRPDIKRGKLSTHEENAIIRLHALLGNRWSTIAAHIPKRTDNEIKNYWNSRLKKRLLRMGIDPTTHKPKNNPASRSAQSSHAAQWEAARLEAEARQGRESSKLPYRLASPPPPPLPRPRHLRAPPCLDVLKVWQSTAIPICFFSSPGNSSLDIESPTSTLSFSSSGATVPAVTAVAANDYGACGVGSRDDTENTFKPCDDQILYPNYCDLTASINQDYEECSMGGEDSNYNDWNELVNMVSTPMMEPLLF